MLAINANHPVSLDTLVERLWDQHPPTRAYHSIYTYVARLRRLLEADGEGAARIARNGASYSLHIKAESVDLHKARALLHRALNSPDEIASRLYCEALELWQGETLSGLRGAWTERTRSVLRQERLAALTARYAAELRLGRHSQIVGELSGDVSEHPLDEALAGLLMVSLHRCTRQADAIAVFHQIKGELVRQLGLYPGPQLQRLYEGFLRNDSGLKTLAV